MNRDLSIRKHWDDTEQDQLRKWQADRLRRYLKQTVLPFSAYYREVFKENDANPEDVRSLDDLRHFPFTRKRDLLATDENPKRARDFILIPDEDVLKKRPSTIVKAVFRGKKRVQDDFAREYRPILMTSTTGRSSDPVPFFYSQLDIDNLTLSGLRLMEICKSRSEFKHLNLFPFAPHLAFWQAHYSGIGFNTFMLSTGGGKVMGTSGNVRMIDKVQPDALIGMPTFIYHVMQEAVNEGVKCSSLKRIVLGGEKAPEGMRRKLRAMAEEMGADAVDVIPTYGFTEAKVAWPECPVAPGESSTGYHLYPDLGLVEVIDPESGEPVEEGQPGEIVYTPLNSRGSVVLRYRTGDEISDGLTYEPCPACGRKVPRLLGRISRVSDYRRMNIDKVKGTLINFNELEHILDDIEGIGAWQIELRKKNDDPMETDEIIVHATSSSSASAGREEMADEIRKRFSEGAEIRPNEIKFHEAKEMRKKHGVGESLKEEKIVDNRPKSESNS